MDSAADSSDSAGLFEEENGGEGRMDHGLPGDGSAGCGGLHRWLRRRRDHYHPATPADTSGGEFGLNRHYDPVRTPQEAQHRNGMADSPFRFCIGDRAGVERIRL